MTRSAVASTRPRHVTWLISGLCVLVAGAPLTVNAFGPGYRAAFQVLAFGLGLLVLAETRSAALVLAGRPRGVILPLVALWVYLVVRAPATLDRPAALTAVLDRTALLVVMAIVAAGILGPRRWALVRAGLVGMAVVAAWGIAQRFGVHPFIDPEVWQPSRPTRPLGTHNLMGVYLAAWLPAAAAMALVAAGRRKLAWGAVVLLGLGCFLLSESRGAWLATAAAIAIMLPWFVRGGAQLVRTAAARDRRGTWLLVAAALLVVIACGGSVAGRLATREQSGLLDAGPETAASAPAGERGASALTSFERRRQLVQTALDLVRERPLFGFGTGSFRLAFYGARRPIMQQLEAETGETAVHAHADGLELAAELGLVGVALAVIGLVAAARRAFKRIDPRGRGLDNVAPKPRSDAAAGVLVETGIVVGGIALGLHALVDFPLAEVPTALVGAVFLGLAAGEMSVPGVTALAAEPLDRRGRREVRVPRVARLVASAVLVAGIGAALAVAASERAYRRAYAVLSTGDLARSERWLERGLRWSPDKARDWVAYAEVARHRARLAATPAERAEALLVAAARFRTAAELEPEIGARWLRAAIALDEARAAGAPVSADSVQALFGAALARNAYLARAHTELIRLEREGGDLAAAESALATAERTMPGSAALLVERGRLRREHGDHAGALAALDAAVAGGEKEVALAALGEIAALARAGDTAAVTLLERIAEAKALEPAARAAALRFRGDVALAAGDHTGARGWFEQALATGESSPELELGLGNLAYASGQLEAAERRYRAALAARPDMAEAMQNLGAVAIARGDTALALRYYARALVLVPANGALRAYVAEITAARER